MRYDAVLFDVDGTLLDTKELIRHSYRYAMAQQFRVDVPDWQLEPLWGKSLPICYDSLGAHFGLLLDDEQNQACRALHNEFQERNLELVKAFDGARETLLALRAAGIRVAMVSSRLTNGKRMLANAGLLDIADFVVMGDEVRRHKPHPEALLRAMDALGSTRAVMVGDTKFDIQAAKRAGIPSIGVTYGHAGRRIALSRPTLLASSLPAILEHATSPAGPADA